jgi:hypothetical protein
MKILLFLLISVVVISGILIAATGGPSTVHCVQRVNANATCYDSPGGGGGPDDHGFDDHG